MAKEKDLMSIKEGINHIQSKIATGELEVSQSLLSIFNVFSDTDDKNFKNEAEMLKKYHPKEYKEYLALLRQIQQKEKSAKSVKSVEKTERLVEAPSKSVEEQQQILMEDALILWKTEGYPRENFKKNPGGKKHEKEWKAARAEFEETFNTLYKDKKIMIGDQQVVYSGISFNANYNTYDVFFSYHKAGEGEYTLRIGYTGKIIFHPNILSASADKLDDESKKLLEEIFTPHDSSSAFKQYREANIQQKISA